MNSDLMADGRCFGCFESFVIDPSVLDVCVCLFLIKRETKRPVEKGQLQQQLRLALVELRPVVQLL